MFDEYFAHKKAQLGLGRADYLSEVQATLDAWYPGLTRVRKFHQGVLRVVTPNASVAGDLRMRTRELLALHPVADGQEVQRIQVSIATLT